jgi:adenylate cyclase
MERRIAAVMAADVVGYSRLIGEDEAGTLQALRQLRQDLLYPAVSEHHGTVIKTMGDGWLIEFASVVHAVNCATQVQEKLSAQDTIKLRVGVHIGDIVHEDEDIYGDGVNIAARLQEIATPGGMALSDTAIKFLDDKLACKFRDAGEKQLKNITMAVRVFLSGVGSEEEQDSAPNAHASLLPPDKPSVAVLPFENLSGDSDQNFFADGIAEDLVTELSRYRSFFVVARNSSFAYRDASLTNKQIGEELGVRYVVRGSVRSASNRVRVTVQLAEAISGRQLWAERYDRLMDDVFAVQDEIIFAIVTMLEPQVVNAERERARRKPTQSLDAWEAYQRGLWHVYQYTAEDNAIGQELLDRATQIDPDFASAYAGLAYSISLNRSMGYLPDESHSADRVYELARKAIALDANDALAHAALGRAYLLRGDASAAISNFREALDVSPNHAVALQGLGSALCWSGQAEESLTALDDALQRNPHDPINWIVMEVKSEALIFTDAFEDALIWAKNGQRQANAGVWPYANEVVALACLHRTDEAKTLLKELPTREPGFSAEFVRQYSLISHPPYLERYLSGLYAAGLPEE